MWFGWFLGQRWHVTCVAVAARELADRSRWNELRV